MKKIIVFCLLFVSALGYSKERVEYTYEGFERRTWAEFTCHYAEASIERIKRPTFTEDIFNKFLFIQRRSPNDYFNGWNLWK